MGPRENILHYLHSHDWATGRELREHLGISRQALHRHLQLLIRTGDVVKAGSTRAARYGLASRAAPPAVVARRIALAGLDESDVYERIALTLNLAAGLRHNVESIVRYAFTEMLNNAIEHSGCEQCALRFELAAGAASFTVRDRGVGVFASIAARLDLESEQMAMVELLKGRTTTMPEAHTGEGLFFTSRAADRFLLRSHRIQVEWDSGTDDVYVSKQRFIEGTGVRFLIRRTSRRRLEAIFNEFAPAEYDFRFDRTRVHVNLLRHSYVSRSEAKRLLANLEKFREVVLDFRGVESVGQGFADEVFRVFASRHPEVAVHTANTNEVIDAMFKHVRK